MFAWVATAGCGAEAVNNERDTAQTKTVSINVTTGNPKSVEPLIYGFSTAAMYWQIEATNDTFLNAVSALKPNVLRFPGGTLAEFYHWDKPGYGLNYDELKKYNATYAESLKEQNAFEARRGARYVDDFVLLAKRLNADVLVCANMLTGTVEEMRSLLRFLEQNNVNVIGVELGNEMYLPKLQKFFPTPQSYIDACKPFAAALRSEFPKTKIGVVAAPFLKISDEPGETDKVSAYYQSFNNAVAKETFYDAYVVHYYFPFDCESVADKCSADRLNQIVNDQLPKSFAYYTGLFGTQRKQWITEWNIATAQTKGRYGNTAFQACFIQSFYHTLNKLNTQYNNAVTIATYQTLAGNVIGSNMIMTPYKRETFRDTRFGKFIRRVPWFANALVEPVFVGNVKMVEATLSENLPGVQAYAYADASARVYIYVVNNGNSDITIGEITLNGKKLSNVKSDFLQPDAATAGFGWNKASGANGPSATVRYDVQNNSAPVTVKRFGCGYLHGTPN